MSKLIPTAIVDVNGRQTTVHKRAEEVSKANGTLAGIKPSLGAIPAGEELLTIKPKKLPALSDSVRIGKVFGVLTTEDEIESFTNASGRKPIQMSNDEAYAAIGNGFTLQDAAALENLGISQDDVMEKTKDAFLVGGSLNMATGRNRTYHRTATAGVLDRLKASGVSAVDAGAMIANGFQDGHLDRALNDEQLGEIFSKWRFRSAIQAYEHGPVDQDDVIDAFVSGRLPFEASQHKIASLKNAESELYDLYERKLAADGRSPYKRNEELAERLTDLDYRAKLIDKAATAMPNEYRALVVLDKLVQNYGMEVLELHDPRMASMTIFVSPGVNRECGVEAARYVERVRDLASDEAEGDLFGTSMKSHESQGAVRVNDVYLRNWELLDLYEHGVPAEESYDLMVKHRLTREQILVARETGVESTLASGVL